MIYAASITTPANTVQSSPLQTRLKVTKGLIYRFELQMPPGPCGFLYVRVKDGSYQVWPSTPEEWFRGDELRVGFDDTYLKMIAPFEFVVETYNLDDTHEHWCQVRVGVVSAEIFLARFLPSYSFQYFKSMLEELGRTEADRRASFLEEFKMQFGS